MTRLDILKNTSVCTRFPDESSMFFATFDLFSILFDQDHPSLWEQSEIFGSTDAKGKVQLYSTLPKLNVVLGEMMFCKVVEKINFSSCNVLQLCRTLQDEEIG